MSSVYLTVDWKTGQLVETSKVAKEGFEQYTTSKDNVKWRKFYEKGVIGELSGVEMKNSLFGTQLVLSLKGDDWYNLQVSALDQRDQITDYALEIGRFLPNLKKGEVYRVLPTMTKKDGKENMYDKRGVSFKLGDAEGEEVAPALSWAANSENPIPRLDWKKDTFTGKKKPSATSVEARNEFFSALFEREIARISQMNAVENAPAPASFAPPSDAPVKTPPVDVKAEEIYDDLPF
jgi:hypothetical protein